MDPGADAERESRLNQPRAQTTLGFALGASIFLVALLAVFLFVPGIIGPFVDGGQEQLVASNRVASTLAGGMLGDPATPHRLDTDCTRAFFNESQAVPCHFDHAESLQEMVGLSDSGQVNVTLSGNISAPDGPHQLCWDSGGLVEADDGSCSSHMSIGNAAPDGVGSTVASRRIVTVDGTQVELQVETW